MQLFLMRDNINILSYMASNGLVANQAKTVFMVLNMKKQCDKQLAAEGISVGGTTVKPDSHTKLLGMTIESNQGWNEHFKGPNSLINGSGEKHRKYVEKRYVISIKSIVFFSTLTYVKVRYCPSGP